MRERNEYTEKLCIQRRERKKATPTHTTTYNIRKYAKKAIILSIQVRE